MPTGQDPTRLASRPRKRMYSQETENGSRDLFFHFLEDAILKTNAWGREHKRKPQPVLSPAQSTLCTCSKAPPPEHGSLFKAAALSEENSKLHRQIFKSLFKRIASKHSVHGQKQSARNKRWTSREMAGPTCSPPALPCGLARREGGGTVSCCLPPSTLPSSPAPPSPPEVDTHSRSAFTISGLQSPPPRPGLDSATFLHHQLPSLRAQPRRAAASLPVPSQTRAAAMGARRGRGGRL